MRHLQPWRAAAACVLSLALLLAACDDGGDAAGTETATTGTATTETATPGLDAPTATATAGAGSSVQAPSVEEPDPARAFEALQHLAGEIGIRPAGSDAERAAAEWLGEQFEAAGYDVTLEEFTFETTRNTASVTVPGEASVFAWSMNGAPDGEASGPLVYAGLGSEEETAAVEAEGAVVLLERGTLTFSQKAAAAQAAGAVAVVIANNEPGLFAGSVGQTRINIPVVAISQEDGEALRMLAGQGVAVEVSAQVEDLDARSQNVVARTPGAECVAYLGAHYDSVPQGPGANDNASGTAAMLELARTHRVPGLCAIGFGAEELGLFGSRDFVNVHDLEGVHWLFNIDMAGKATNPEAIAGDVALAERVVEAARGAGEEVAVGEFPPFASSDHAPFSEAGIPAFTLHSGNDPLIHTSGDDLDNVSEDSLARMLRIATAGLRAVLGDFTEIEARAAA